MIKNWHSPHDFLRARDVKKLNHALLTNVLANKCVCLYGYNKSIADNNQEYIYIYQLEYSSTLRIAALIQILILLCAIYL